NLRQTATCRMFAMTDPAELQAEFAKIQEYEKDVNRRCDLFEPNIRKENVRAAYSKFRENARQCFVLRKEKVLTPLLNGKKAEAMQGMASIASIFDQLPKGVGEVIDLKTEQARHEFERSQAQYVLAWWLLSGMIAGGVLFAVLAGWIISRMVVVPL